MVTSDRPLYDPTSGPLVYPICSVCECPYVLRRCFIFGRGAIEWLWQRDCKHKTAPATTAEVAAP